MAKDPLQYLKTLARRPEWRISDLPSEITEDVLCVLDGNHWVVFRIWHLDDPNPQPFEDGDPSTYVPMPVIRQWFSPRWDSSMQLNMADLFADHRGDSTLSPEVRITKSGQYELALQRIGGAPEAAPPKAAAGEAEIHAGVTLPANNSSTNAQPVPDDGEDWAPYDEVERLYGPSSGQLTKMKDKNPKIRRDATSEDREKWKKPKMLYIYNKRLIYEARERDSDAE